MNIEIDNSVAVGAQPADDGQGILKVGPISGFPEVTPDLQAVTNRVLDVIKTHYRNAGALPITTPLVERIDVLTSKGGGAISKEIYGLTRLSSSADGSTESLGLKFDLTVPTARYVAQRQNNLVFPFRRQQIDRVHRGERPQAGRYREFIQADFDVIGRETLDITTDAEPLAIINNIFEDLDIGPFVVRINNRKILNGFFQELGLDLKSQAVAMGVIDKADDGRVNTANRLCEKLDCTADIAEAILDFIYMPIDVTKPAENLELYRLNELLSEGIDELIAVINAALAFGVPQERIKADLSVARGLDYYTGTVYETVLLEHANLGSICSGGRYDDLASQFTTGKFPGVGISIGVTRLVPRLLKAGILKVESAFQSHVLMTRLDNDLVPEYLRITNMLRLAGIPTEVVHDEKPLGQQLKYAVRKGYGKALILGSNEVNAGTIQVRDLIKGSQTTAKIEDIVKVLQEAG